MSPSQDGNRTDRAVGSHCHQIRIGCAGRGETHWHVSFPAQTFRRSWGQRADRSPFILSLLLLLRVCASLAAWHPGGDRENAQQEKP